MSESVPTKKTNPVFDVILSKPGQTITVDGKTFIKIGCSTWKNAELQIVHCDLIMPAEPASATGEIRDVKALVRVFKNA